MIRAVIFDLDGTLHVGERAISGAAEKIAELKQKGIQTLFLTNAATSSRKDYAEKLRDMGLQAEEGEVYCSSYLLARYLEENHKGRTVFVIGERGIPEELSGAGIETVAEGADIVVVGLDRQFTYGKLAKALKELEGGAMLIATNMDATFPTEDGLMPGTGSLVAAVEAASRKKAYVIGKPNCFPLEVIGKEHGLKRDEILVVGDRLETDIAFARRCGVRSALVLSGISRKEEIGDLEPDYVFESVAQLTLP